MFSVVWLGITLLLARPENASAGMPQGSLSMRLVLRC